VPSRLAYLAGPPDLVVDPTLSFPLTVPPAGDTRISSTMVASAMPGELTANEFGVSSDDPAAQQSTPRFTVPARTAGPRLVYTELQLRRERLVQSEVSRELVGYYEDDQVATALSLLLGD
jgi:hypothetical protein